MVIETHTLAPSEIQRLEGMLADGTLESPSEVARLKFALGDHFERTGDHARAFAYYQRANRVKTALYHYDPNSFDQTVDEACAELDRDVLESISRFGSTSTHPILVVGMMRSGTTLAEQILASHPDVAAGGERRRLGALANALPGLLGRTGAYRENLRHLTPEVSKTMASAYLEMLDKISTAAARVTDKAPGNFVHLGLFFVLFPNAKIIHCRRDPRDTCLSIYCRHFRADFPYAYDLYLLGRRYRAYMRLMDHWRRVLPDTLFDLQYEELVGDQEAVSRRMLDFCGLQWNDRVLSYHDTRRAIDTSSVWQVRQPMYKSSVGRWKRFREHLEPLERGLRGEPR